MADLKTTPVETPAESETKPARRRSLRRSLWILLGVIAGFVVYAYGFEVVDVNLDRVSNPLRQQRFFNVMRALGHPDLLTYETVATGIDIDFAMPCPSGTFTASSSGDGASISVDPQCADPRARVTVTGEGFRANEPINIFFVPPNGLELRVAQARSDSDGAFTVQAQLPNRPDEEVQVIRAKSRETVGGIFSPVQVPTGEIDPDTGEEITVRSPRWSTNAEATWKGIIETIFLALLATTVGTLIAMPLSFLAARNLMSDVRVPTLNVGLAVAVLPVGAFLGYTASKASATTVDLLPGSALLLGMIVLALVWLSVRLVRITVPLPGETRSGPLRVGGSIAAIVTFLLAAHGTVRFMEIGGRAAAGKLGPVAFLGTFVERNGEIFALVFGVLSAVAGAVALAVLASKLSYTLAKRIPQQVDVVLSIVAVGLAGVVLALGAGQVISWIYQIVNPIATMVIPAIVGAVIGLALGAWGAIRGQLGAGLGIYYVFRTLFNTLRSIEALIVALVFVIWVGIGAFAGTLALALHTIAANAKLYSEQVESISSG
ncbi:MAG TPA: hypothetical protein VE569_00835, partial [Acidimicrobiia bacterium]|nr:hypothetical protein [Acidimicrobiia bacterium]